MRIVALVLGVSLLGACQNSPPSPPPPPVVQVSPPPPSPSVNPEQAKEAAQYRQLGLKYRAAGNFSASLAALEKSVALAPHHLEGRVILGWTQHLAQKRQEAITTLTTALEQEPNHVSALNALGIVYLVEGNLEQAVTTHNKALELKNDNEIAHFNLALAYHRLADYDRAIAHAQKATTLEPENAHTWVALALVQWSSGEKKLARQSYVQAQRLDGRYGNKAFLSHLEQAAFSPKQIKIVGEIFDRS